MNKLKIFYKNHIKMNGEGIVSIWYEIYKDEFQLWQFIGYIQDYISDRYNLDISAISFYFGGNYDYDLNIDYDSECISDDEVDAINEILCNDFEFEFINIDEYLPTLGITYITDNEDFQAYADETLYSVQDHCISPFRYDTDTSTMVEYNDVGMFGVTHNDVIKSYRNWLDEHKAPEVIKNYLYGLIDDCYNYHYESGSLEEII